MKHCAPSLPVSKLQRQTSCFPGHSRDLSLHLVSCLKVGWLCMPCSSEHHRELHGHRGCRTGTCCFILGQVAQEQSSLCLTHKRLWGGEGQARSEDLCSSLLWLLHLCITHEPVSLLEHSKHNESQLLVSHSYLCLFYLKLSLLGFEARDQTNKREFGSCNVWSAFCSEVKLKIAPKPIHRHSFWRPFGRI